MDYLSFLLDNTFVAYNDSIALVDNLVVDTSFCQSIDNYWPQYPENVVIRNTEGLSLTEKGEVFFGFNKLSLPSRAVTTNQKVIQCRDGGYYDEKAKLLHRIDVGLLGMFKDGNSVNIFGESHVHNTETGTRVYVETMKQVVYTSVDTYWLLSESGKLYSHRNVRNHIKLPHTIKRLFTDIYDTSVVYEATDEQYYRFVDKYLKCFKPSNSQITYLHLNISPQQSDRLEKLQNVIMEEMYEGRQEFIYANKLREAIVPDVDILCKVLVYPSFTKQLVRSKLVDLINEIYISS